VYVIGGYDISVMTLSTGIIPVLEDSGSTYLATSGALNQMQGTRGP